MENYAKTILSCYDTIDGYITQIENVIKIKAKNSFYLRNGTVTLAEQLISLGEIRKDLIELSEIVDKMLKKMTEEDKILISYKYFGVKPKDENFDLTSRNYFRKQIRALKRFSELLVKNNYDEEWFKNKYLKIAYISSIYQLTLNENGKKHIR